MTESFSDRPEFHDFTRRIQRAIRLTEQLNALRYDDLAAVRTLWTTLTGQAVDETFHLIPPVYSDHGTNIRVGRNVFVNQGCRFNDIGGIELGDDIMLAPGVNLITGGHPVAPALRRTDITTAPIRIESNVWIGTNAIVLQGVTIGAGSVIAAGAVVTQDVPPATLSAGIPAHPIRNLTPTPEATT